MTIKEIKGELGFSKISFFTVLNKDKEETAWRRAVNHLTGDFLIAHEEVVDALLEDKSISNLYLKRVEDTILVTGNKDGVLHRTFMLCRSNREAYAEF